MTTREEVIAAAKEAGFNFGYLGFVFAGTSLETIERLYKSGAASRDVEIQRLQMALADAEALEIGTAEKCNQLRAELAKLQAENVAYASNLRGKHSIAGATYETLRQQLAAEQAKNVGLRECLSRVDGALLIPYNGGAVYAISPNDHKKFKEALSTPSDTSVLEAMITKAGEKMREKCEKVCDEIGDSSNGWCCEGAIRALPGVTLEDLGKSL